MQELLVMVCLLAQPDICQERLLPLPKGAECPAVAEAAAHRWQEGDDRHRVAAWRCAPAGSAPVLPLTALSAAVLVHQGAPGLPSRENRGAIANLAVVIGERSVAVIDAGASRAQGEALYAAIRAMSDLPISHLILTHMHPDHSFGAEVFREAGAEIIAAPGFAAALEARFDGYLESYGRQIGAEALLGTRIALPDRGVREEVVDLGGQTLVLRAVATAHTDNDLTILHHESGTLFAGDLVFAGLAPTLDGALAGWLGWLSDPPEAVRVVPGHGPASLPWPQGRAATEHYLTALRDQIHAALEAGRPMSAVLDDPPPPGEWLDLDMVHPRNAAAAYKELEWE
ncbi:quinoprotein relay system zinc metallohydrolase 2 [Plastorhodobacter daqingensis]|uniref:Quinoprotein relay system zinc metallohydrolase 2 n=1 Tax=Plastorhodobacter daqingensis TaxID=1387281 RepID=A0ABW2UJH1_9RHOB